MNIPNNNHAPLLVVFSNYESTCHIPSKYLINAEIAFNQSIMASTKYDLYRSFCQYSHSRQRNGKWECRHYNLYQFYPSLSFLFFSLIILVLFLDSFIRKINKLHFGSFLFIIWFLFIINLNLIKSQIIMQSDYGFGTASTTTRKTMKSPPQSNLPSLKNID